MEQRDAASRRDEPATRSHAQPQQQQVTWQLTMHLEQAKRQKLKGKRRAEGEREQLQGQPS